MLNFKTSELPMKKCFRWLFPAAREAGVDVWVALNLLCVIYHEDEEYLSSELSKQDVENAFKYPELCSGIWNSFEESEIIKNGVITSKFENILKRGMEIKQEEAGKTNITPQDDLNFMNQFI